VERRHLGLIERGDVGRLIRIRLQLQVEACRNVSLLDDPRPRRRRAERLNGQAVVLHAADHVEVQISRELRQRDRRLRGKRRPPPPRAQTPTGGCRGRALFDGGPPTAGPGVAPAAWWWGRGGGRPASSFRASELPLLPCPR